MPIPTTSSSGVFVPELWGHPAQYQGVLETTGGKFPPIDSDFVLGISMLIEEWIAFFSKQSAIISLDNSDIFGTNSSLEEASNFPDNRGLDLELKRI